MHSDQTPEGSFAPPEPREPAAREAAEDFDKTVFGHHGEPCDRYVFAAKFALAYSAELRAELAEGNRLLEMASQPDTLLEEAISLGEMWKKRAEAAERSLLQAREALVSAEMLAIKIQGFVAGQRGNNVSPYQRSALKDLMESALAAEAAIKLASTSAPSSEAAK